MSRLHKGIRGLSVSFTGCRVGIEKEYWTYGDSDGGCGASDRDSR